MSCFYKIIALVAVIFFSQITPSVAQLPNTQVYAFDLGRDGAGFSFCGAKCSPPSTLMATTISHNG